VFAKVHRVTYHETKFLTFTTVPSDILQRPHKTVLAWDPLLRFCEGDKRFLHFLKLGWLSSCQFSKDIKLVTYVLP
jgi:hypothetical protein